MNKIETLHQTYITITGISLNPIFHEQTWHLFCQAGFTEEDLKAVLFWIRKHNAKERYQYSVKLSTLVGDLGHFDELLGLAKLRPAPQKSQGQKALEAFRGAEEPLPTNNVIPIKDALKKAVNGL